MNISAAILILVLIAGTALGVGLVVCVLSMRDMARLLGGLVRGSEKYTDEPKGKTGVISPYKKPESHDRE